MNTTESLTGKTTRKVTFHGLQGEIRSFPAGTLVETSLELDRHNTIQIRVAGTFYTQRVYLGSIEPE